MPDTVHFSCHDLDVSVAGRELVTRLGLDVRGGELIAVLGRNGCGKSLTMHTLAGLRTAQTGAVRINDLDVHSIKRAVISRRLALLPQHVDDVFPATVFETVMIGRHPHVGTLGWESADDVQKAHDALRSMDISELSERDVMTLSGGERRRLAIAQVLAQDPDLYLLDEPTNHLDPQHQLDTLRLFRQRVNKGNAVVATLHDVNLAVRFADRCLLLYGDGRWDLGNCSEVLTAARLSDLYATPMEAIRWRDRELFVASGDEAL